MSGLDASTTPASNGAGRHAPMPPSATEPPTLSGPLAETLHRLANNLAILSATLRMEQRRVGDPVARAALGDAVARIEAMAQVHRLIYGLGPGERVELLGFLGHLAPVIGTSLGMGCGVRGAPVTVSGRTAEGLAVATVELALNAYKHGYGGAPGRGVEVRVGRRPGGWARLTVRDWGRGLAEAARPFSGAGTEADGAGLGDALGAGLEGGALGGARGGARGRLRGGFGLRLVASAVETLGGRVTTVTDGGARVVVEVPQG